MNWVGGSRSRLVMKNDAKKQREFFEKRKMQQRLKNLGITLPTSPRGTSCGSMDLVTLFVVNQIAAKKENKDPPKVAVLGSSKGWSKHKRNEPLVLPMSPCSPSQLNLVESQPQYSLQGTRQRKHVIPQGFKYRQLSPVFESAFSDNSASDYLPPITDPLSPFSFTSPASSGQGMFPLQLNLQQRSQRQAQLPPHCSPPPWGISGLEQTKFQPFSQPRDMTDCFPWSHGSKPPVYHLETPPAARVLFGSPKPDNTEARKHARQEVTFCVNQPEDREPMLDFTLNHSDTEADIFRGFNAEEYEREASQFEGRKLKICLNDETPVKSSAPQIVPNSECMGVEFSNCTDMNCSHLEHNSGLMNGSDCSPSFSCRRGYLSSDSNDEEECYQPSLHDASAYMDQACCADGLNSNMASQVNSKQRHAQRRLSTPLLKPKMNFRDDQKVREEVAGPNEAMRNKIQQMGSHTAQLDSPQALAQSQPAETCKCKKASSETRDAGTQTANAPTAETCDASTQCSFAIDRATKSTGFNLCLPPVDVQAQHPATGRQSDTAAQQNAHTASPGEARSGGKHTPWSKTPIAGSLSGSLNKITANNGNGKVVTQRPINPFQDVLSMTYGRARADEKGQQENDHLSKHLSTEVRKEEATSTARVRRPSGETETLQEVADILLLLKQVGK